MQPVFDAPVGSDDLVEAFGRQRRAQQIIGDLYRCFSCRFADALDLADGRQTRPLMVFDQPSQISRNCRRARLDAAMIAIDLRLAGRRPAGWIIEKQNDVSMKRCLISLELCRKVGDGGIQAADLISAAISIPSLNLTPLMTLGN